MIWFMNCSSVVSIYRSVLGPQVTIIFWTSSICRSLMLVPTLMTNSGFISAGKSSTLRQRVLTPASEKLNST